MLSQHEDNINQLLENDIQYKKYIFNQRFLMKCLSDFLKSGKYINPLDHSIDLSKVCLLMDLKSMLCNEAYSGWLLKDILTELLKNSTSEKIQFGLFKPPISVEGKKAIEELNKWFGEIKIYPIVFKRSFKCELFHNDLTVDTFSAMYLLKAANDITSSYVHLPSVPSVTSDNKQFMTKVKDYESSGQLVRDKISCVLIELLSAQVLQLNILDNVMFDSIKKNILLWDACADVTQMIMNDQTIAEDDKQSTIWTYGQCALVQSMLLDMLELLPQIKLMNLYADYDKSLKEPREKLPLPIKCSRQLRTKKD